MQSGLQYASVGAYVPPHLTASRATIDTRYSRDQLLDLYRDQKEAGELATGIDDLLVGDWSDSLPNGASSGRWGRREEVRNENVYGPDICWDRGGATEPSGLYDMTDEEREVCVLSWFISSSLLNLRQAVLDICKLAPQRSSTGRHSRVWPKG